MTRAAVKIPHPARRHGTCRTLNGRRAPEQLQEEKQMKSMIYAMMLALALFVGPLTLLMTATGCSTIGTAAEGTGDVAGEACRGTSW